MNKVYAQIYVIYVLHVFAFYFTFFLYCFLFFIKTINNFLLYFINKKLHYLFKKFSKLLLSPGLLDDNLGRSSIFLPSL